MKRGYIGPLGDDFPALFPITLGLMLFFSAIVLAYMIHDAKSVTVNLMRANIMISRAVREQTHFTGEYWKVACAKMNNTRVNYGVKSAMRIVMANYTEYPPTGLHSIQLPSNKTEGSVMLTDSGGTKYRAVCPLDAEWENYVPTNALAMSYPVVVDSQGQILPATLVVVTWV